MICCNTVSRKCLERGHWEESIDTMCVWVRKSSHFQILFSDKLTSIFSEARVTIQTHRYFFSIKRLFLKKKVCSIVVPFSFSADRTGWGCVMKSWQQEEVSYWKHSWRQSCWSQKGVHCICLVTYISLSHFLRICFVPKCIRKDKICMNVWSMCVLFQTLSLLSMSSTKIWSLKSTLWLPFVELTLGYGNLAA